MVTPICFLNIFNDAAALLLARGADFLSAFDKPQRDALVMVFLPMHGQGILANEVFWDSVCFPSACWCTGRGFFRASSAFG
jgi:hypothetical protein